MDGNRKDKVLTVGIVGAGLVGSLNASYFAKRGYQVNLYEYRQDIRLMEHVPGRSINLALSIRGRESLRRVGLEEKIVFNHGIPMYARMIHNRDGTKRSIPYGKKDQCIYSISRRYLNETLLTEAESYPNVKVFFEHKLISADLDTGKLHFRVDRNYEKEDKVDLIIGNDGAFSAVRKEMMKRPRFNCNQFYIPHAYKELCMPADKNGQFAMEKNYLHIWPRGQFMMIALPNQDVTWTVTLFMPFEIFESLNTAEKLLDFFEKEFPDSIPLIGREKLIEDYFRVEHSPLVTVKCFPYHVGQTSLIMGDAAHAMVPFYGQGMNCGLEDCLVLDDIMTRNDGDLMKSLSEFSTFRNPDAEAICDLAMYNYVEMRDLVNSRLFLVRKYFDNLVNLFLPNTWVPLYTMVTFSRTRYHECIANKKWQDRVVSVVLKGTCLIFLVTVVVRHSHQITKLVSQHLSRWDFSWDFLNW